MLTTLLLIAVLAILLGLLALQLVGGTKVNTRLDEFSHQGETRSQRLESLFQAVEKELRNDVEGVRKKVDESLEKKQPPAR